MLTSGEIQCSGLPKVAQDEQQNEEEEDFLVSDTNRILFDANQMLIDLKNEIDKKNALITNNVLLVEGLKEEVAKKTEDLEELKKGHKREIFEKDKLVIIVTSTLKCDSEQVVAIYR